MLSCSRFPLRSKKVCYRYKVSLCDNCQRQSCNAFTGPTVHEKLPDGGRPPLPEISSKSESPRWSEIANFRSNFARSDSAVTPSINSSINTNRKSTARFPMSARWTSYVVPKPPKRWLKYAKCPKFEQKAATTRKQYEMGCQLLLITNRKSHTGFRLVPTSMTLKLTMNA